MMYNPFYYNFFIPFMPPNCDKPPTLYSVLNSIVNGEKEESEYTKIKDLAKEGRSTIFDFEYPLSENINKEDFECMILNKFLMRRIGFETVNAFKIQLNVKLNEIMPMYNKLFDSLENWNLFTSGERTEKTGINENESENNSENNLSGSNSLTNQSSTQSNNISDRRFSDTPQNQLQNVQNGSYMTDYNYDQNNASASDSSTSNGTQTSTQTNSENSNSTNNYHEIIERTPADKISIYKEFQDNLKSIYTLIFNDLEILFYQLI